MNEDSPGESEAINESTSSGDGFDSFPKDSFEEFRAKIASEDDVDMSEFDLSPLDANGESNNAHINSEDSVANISKFDLTPIESIEDRAFVSEEEEPVLPDGNFEERFDLTPLESDGDGFMEVASNDFVENQVKSSENGSLLEKTDTPGIMRSDYDDNLYHVSENGEITPLKSPVNGSKLELTDTPGIVRSDYDDILYSVSKNGEITPLQSPENGNNLMMTDGGAFVDNATGQQFSLNDIKNR